MAPQLAEPFYLYGAALLEVARMESDVLGNALDGGEIITLKEYISSTLQVPEK